MRSKAELGAAIRRDRRAALVVNARSRRGRMLYHRARRHLHDAGFNLLTATPVDDPAQLDAALHTALTGAPDLLVVGGGDGTISRAVRHLAYRDVCLGILPLGTTNNFARGLRIPTRLPDAVEVLTAGKVIDVDLGLCDGLPFANHLSVGVSAAIAARTPAWLKRRLGPGAYLLTALAVLARHRPFTAHVSTGGHEHTMRTHQLVVANAARHTGRPISADASGDDRQLWLYPLGGPTRRGFIAAVIRQFTTGARRTHPPTVLISDELRLSTDPPRRVEVDGEIRTHTPIHVTLAGEALRVMAPTDMPDT
jgi:diacylglycerol kinase family enzyme